MSDSSFHTLLQERMDAYVHAVYDYTQDFPREEVYGVTSQLRRAALSIPLNYREGFARQSTRAAGHFYSIAYGSLQESKYLIIFSRKRSWLTEEAHSELSEHAERIGAML